MDVIIRNLDTFTSIGLLFCISLFLRMLLQVMGQAWIKTIAHTATLALLPILTYVITSVISGNIALSLGMVGALSIVRFRNPVRSPLELSVYFCAITMGIAAAVSVKWLLLLVGSVTFVSVSLWLVNVMVKTFTGNSFFITSFSEGNALSTLTVTASSEVTELNSNDSLNSKVTTNNEISYTLASSDFERLRKIESLVRSMEVVTSSQLNK